MRHENSHTVRALERSELTDVFVMKLENSIVSSLYVFIKRIVTVFLSSSINVCKYDAGRQQKAWPSAVHSSGYGLNVKKPSSSLNWVKANNKRLLGFLEYISTSSLFALLH